MTIDYVSAWVHPLLHQMPASIATFATNPGFIERLSLAVLNIPGALMILVGLWLIRSRRVEPFYPLVVLFLTNLIAKVCFGYTYDGFLAIICLTGDLLLLIGLGMLVFQKSAHGSFQKTIATTTIVMTFFCWFGWHQYLPRISIFGPFLATLAVLWHAKNQKQLVTCLKTFDAVAFGVMLMPFLPYLFAAAPPDADVVTVIDITGFLYQGEDMAAAATGIASEQWEIRYPLGLPAIALFVSHTLDIRAAEAMLLLWYLSHGLFVIALRNTFQKIGVTNSWWLLLVLIPTVTGSHGLHGGQIQEQLAYALGILAISMWFKGDQIEIKINSNESICYLLAATLIHPIVALPFAAVVGPLWMHRTIVKKQMDYQTLGVVILSIIVLGYFVSLSGGANTSQPLILLKELTPKIFVDNILHWIPFDTQGWFVAFFVLLLPGYWRYVGARTAGILMMWLVAAMVLDGVFGATKWIARFHANFSTVGIWIVCVGSAGHWLLSRQKLLGHQWLPSQAKPWLKFAPLLLWILAFAPGMPLKPESVFTTHANIRLGRWIEEYTEKGAVILNIRPPGDHNGFGFMARGNTSRHAINSRFGDHQLKNPRIDVAKRELLRQCLLIPTSTLNCLARNGVDYLLIDSRSNSESYLVQLLMPPVARVREAFLLSTGTESKIL